MASVPDPSAAGINRYSQWPPLPSAAPIDAFGAAASDDSGALDPATFWGMHAAAASTGTGFPAVPYAMPAAIAAPAAAQAQAFYAATAIPAASATVVAAVDPAAAAAPPPLQ